MFMYRIWRTSAARLKLCLISSFEKSHVRGWLYTQMWASCYLLCCVFLLSIQFHASDILICIVLMSAIHESINFNWLPLYSDLCILCSDRTAHDYNFVMTCRLYLIYIHYLWVYMFDPWGYSTAHVWLDHCLQFYEASKKARWWRVTYWEQYQAWPCEQMSQMCA